jgi:hypothetical protein
MVHIAFQVNLLGTPDTFGLVGTFQAASSGTCPLWFLRLVEEIERSE